MISEDLKKCHESCQQLLKERDEARNKAAAIKRLLDFVLDTMLSPESAEAEPINSELICKLGETPTEKHLYQWVRVTGATPFKLETKK